VLVKTRRLGNTDLEVTPIGLGCMQFSRSGGPISLAYPALPQETINAVVRAALDGGIGWFDTAELYGRGHSERALTTGLREAGAAPGDVVIATKWFPLGRTAGSIGRTIRNRLGALQGYPIDLHQIHFPAGGLSTHPAQLRAMAELARSGAIKAVGVSNFSARQMRLAHRVLAERGLTLASNQVQISLLRRSIERNGLLRAARELGVTLIGHSPLASGMLTGRFHEDPARYRSVRLGRRVALRVLSQRGLARTSPLIDALRAIANASGVTPAQVALSWLVSYCGDTVVAIPVASKPRQAADAAAAMDLQLSDTELSRLDQLSRHLT
jgi:aryl-alcohol dehydrogenase-like predicted oxidoreductase